MHRGAGDHEPFNCEKKEKTSVPRVAEVWWWTAVWGEKGEKGCFTTAS